MQVAFYDEKKSYEENYHDGPSISTQNQKPKTRTIPKKSTFLGFDVNIPFGIPAGPLLNSEYLKAAFEFGFDVNTYKTVRAEAFPCHPFPNVLYVNVDGELHPDKTPKLVASDVQPLNTDDINITNSFGVPSKPVAFWQEDVKKALSYAKDGQLMILSFMGTVRSDQTQGEFIKDFATVARLANETGVKVLEANLSCPNIGNEGLVCYNLDITEQVCQAIRREIGDTPLILKVGYFKDDAQLNRLAKIVNTYAQGVAAINTLQVEVIDSHGNQALPGKNRLKSGVCGAGIKWAGLEMVQKFNNLRTKHNYTYEIIGVGGVMNPEDYKNYRAKGANLVQSASGAMWNADLAHQIWEDTK